MTHPSTHPPAQTWDFVQLQQGEAYGDIVISAGKRFQDEIVALKTAQEEEDEEEAEQPMEE